MRFHKIFCKEGSAEARTSLLLTYKHADAAVAVSKAMGEELKQLGLGKDKVYSIPNFFDLARIQQLSTAPVDAYGFIDASASGFGTCGSAKPQKELKGTAGCIGNVEKGRKAGKAPYSGRRKTERCTDSASTRSRVGGIVEDGSAVNPQYDVYFLGRQENPYRFLVRARLFLLTSFNEGFPLAMGESFGLCYSCGIRLLSYGPFRSFTQL